MNDDERLPQFGGWRMRHDHELIELANRDLVGALSMLSELSDAGVKIEAQTALHVASRCLSALPPPCPKRPRGRPPRSFEDVIARLSDGKAATEGRPLSVARSPRDAERCMKEYRQFSES